MLPPLPSPALSDLDPYGRRLLAQLTHDRMVLLAAADPQTRRDLVEQVVVSHLWLADAAVRRYLDRGEEADDLRQVARGGLVEACVRFDPEQGPFAAFAFVTVVGLLKRHFRDHGWSVRPPRSTQELSAVIWRRWPELAQTVGGEPSDVDLAHGLGVEVDEVRRARQASQGYSTSSLEGLLVEPGDEDPAGERAEARLLVQRAWSRLSVSEQRLLRLRFYDERSQSEIAAALGTNQMQVSRLLVRLLTKLRLVIGPLDDEPGVTPQAA